MKHKKIQKKFLLYIDGDLSEAEKLLVEQHLNKCSSCKKYFEELAIIWNEEKKFEQPLPSPAIWYILKERMAANREEKFSVWTLFGNAKLVLNTAIVAGVVVLAVFIGAKFGSLLSPPGGTQSETYIYSKNSGDEFGMSYFDAVPPNSIAKDIFAAQANNKGL